MKKLLKRKDIMKLTGVSSNTVSRWFLGAWMSKNGYVKYRGGSLKYTLHNKAKLVDMKDLKEFLIKNKVPLDI